MKPSGPGQSAQLLLEVVRELRELEVPYAVIGALAASFHGVVRGLQSQRADFCEEQVEVLDKKTGRGM